MSMLMGLSLPMHAHESFMSMLMSISRARAHEACTRKTTLGQTASGRAKGRKRKKHHSSGERMTVLDVTRYYDREGYITQ